MDYKDLGPFYFDYLYNKIIPFWENYSLDENDGALNNCIDNNGKIVSKDRYIWSQARALWTFSSLYNNIEKKEKWLSIASGIFEYLKKNGTNQKGEWNYLIDYDRNIKDGPISIFTDGFAIYGLNEYYKASQDYSAIELAIQTFEITSQRLKSDDQYLTFPLPSKEGLISHSIYMVFCLTFFELGKTLDDKKIIDEAKYYADGILSNFFSNRKSLLFEFRSKNQPNYNNGIERVIIPGHAIESMWFLIHIYQSLGLDHKVKDAISCFKSHIEIGWDNKYGGIFLSIDSESKNPWLSYWDTKPWWPITEALYGLLLCDRISGEKWCLDWYWKVHEYGFNNYPSNNYAEWNQKLDREGNIIDNVIGLPVKDPFHLPRAMIMILNLLRI